MPTPPAGQVQLKGSERRPLSGAKLLGGTSPLVTITVSIVVRRCTDGPPLPDFAFYADTPLAQRRRLSEADFAARYGASQADLDAVARFVKAYQLTLIDSNAARRTVIASGTVANMEAAFGVALNQYQVTLASGGRGVPPVTETYRGLDGVVYVPAALDGVIVSVLGLDDRSITRRSMPLPPNTARITVPVITKLYDFPSSSAAGQTLAIFGNNGYDLNDQAMYFASLGPSFVQPAIVAVPIDAGNLGADPETTQDLSIAATVAQGATIAVYFTTPDERGWWDLITRVVTPKAGDLPTDVAPPSVLTCSLFASKSDDAVTLGAATDWLAVVTGAFQDAAVQGVTVCIAAGDDGSDSGVGDGKAHVQYPASDPWVLSCGGTTVGNISGSSFDEYVWNDSSGATGGGVSDYFPLPSYQQGARVPPSVTDEHVGRGVPDVAGNASSWSAYGDLYLGGEGFGGEGTSAVAPLYAGLIALLNAALGERIGFLNPTLYQLGNSVCRDITPTAGPTSNACNGAPGYPAGSGWDACTGWGVINGKALLSALQALQIRVPKSQV
jgi:kumamolisin